MAICERYLLVISCQHKINHAEFAAHDIIHNFTTSFYTLGAYLLTKIRWLSIEIIAWMINDIHINDAMKILIYS